MNRRRFLLLPGVIAVLLMLVPAGAGPADELQVVDSAGVGAAVGLITRVPAESPGGAVYASSTITADKAVSRAAGFYPGFLVDTFLRTSSPLYANPTEAVAQHPPGAYPERAETQGGQDGPLGSGARFAAVADGAPSSRATATGARLAPAGSFLSAAKGSATSQSRLLDDGTVVTEVRASVRDVAIGTSVTVAEATGTAVVRTPPSGSPVTTLETRIAGLFVGGVAARLDENGLRVADRSIVSAEQMAAFNRGLASLAAAGITVRAAPRIVERATGSGRVAGAAMEIGYSAGANALEEVVLLAQVAGRSVAQAALDGGDDDGFPFAASASGGEDAVALSPLGAGLDAAASVTSPAADGDSAVAAAPLGSGALAADAPSDPFALLGSRGDTRVLDRIRTTYGLLVLLAFVGVGLAASLGRGPRAS